jgi:F0F1-type ATP synthase assembly protein I
LTIPGRQSDLKRLAVLGGLAMEMAFSVMAGTVFGYALDRFFETEPVLTIIFMLVGLLGGVVAFVKIWSLLKEKF